MENSGNVVKENEQRTPRRKKSAFQKGRKKRQSLGDIQEGSTTQTEQPQRPQTPWEQFENHVKNIHDDSGQYISPNTQGLQLKSSDAFQKVMTDINQKRKEKELRELKRQEEAARLRMEKMKNEGEGENKEEIVEEEESEEEDSEEEEEIVIEASPAVKMAARRGWAIIRRKIQELRMERKNEADQSWSFLKNTLKNMTNMEKAREELYEKYIYKPNTWKDGIKNFPDHILPNNRPTNTQRDNGRSVSRTISLKSASTEYEGVSAKKKNNDKSQKKRKRVP